MKMVFEKPDTGYKEEVNTISAGILTLLFGPLYFLAKGVYGHAVICLVLSVITYGLAWLIYPFFTGTILEKHYGRQGFKRIDKAAVPA